MNQAALLALCYIGGSLLFLAGIVVLAFGARAWSDATANAHRARAHGAQAAATEATIDEATDAIENANAFAARAQRTPPSPDAIREVVLAGRANGRAHLFPDEVEPDYTTLGNENAEPEHNAFDGGPYVVGN